MKTILIILSILLIVNIVNSETTIDTEKYPLSFIDSTISSAKSVVFYCEKVIFSVGEVEFVFGKSPGISFEQYDKIVFWVGNKEFTYKKEIKKEK